MAKLTSAAASGSREPARAGSPERGGERAAFEAAATACRPYLLRVAMVQLRDRDLAEDTVQETLMSAYRGLARFTGEATVRTWLTAILKHKILDALRRRGREPIRASELHAELDLGDIEEAFDNSAARAWELKPAEWPDPAASWEQTAFFDMVDFCLHRLPPAAARVFMMRELFEMDTREICRELDITAANCRVLLYRARMALRQCLESNWFLRPVEA